MLKHVFQFIYGDSLPATDRVNDGEIPVYGSNGVIGRHDRANIVGPAIVIGRKGSAGELRYESGAGFVIDTAYAARPRGVDGRWGYWLFTALDLPRLAAHSAVPGLSLDQFATTPVPVPPEKTQRSIASFLDRETSRIDTLIEKKRRLLDLLEEKRTALITRAVTRGLDPDVPMKDSGVEWIGEIPKHWEVVRLKHLTPPGRPITYGIVQAGPHVPDGIPYIRTSDLAGDTLPADGYQRTSKAIDAQYARSRVHPGDVVVAIRATVGKSLLVPYELPHANLTQGTARVAAGSRVLPAFVHVGLSSSHTQQRFSALAKGATFREITLRMLRQLEFCVPPLEEQRAILSHLEREMGQFSTLRSSIRRGINLLQEYRTAVIFACVTGNIEVRQQVAV